jgi:undecaprenyl-diphosphatase
LRHKNAAVKSPETKKESYRKHIWLVAVSVILFVMLALYVRAGITVGFEGWVYSETVEHMSPVMTDIVKGITHIGDASVVMAFCILLIIIPKTRKTIALPVSSAVILSALLNIVLKELFARERPDILRLINETSYSFPSGHAMINATLYTMLIIMVFKFIKSPPRIWGLSLLCIMLILSIGFSRVYLGVHYAGDIIGGWIIGFAVTILVYVLWKRFVYHEPLMLSL